MKTTLRDGGLEDIPPPYIYFTPGGSYRVSGIVFFDLSDVTHE